MTDTPSISRQQITNWLIDPSSAAVAAREFEKSESFLDKITASSSLSRIEIQPTMASTRRDMAFFDRFETFRPFTVRDGVLQIPVSGTLRGKFPFATGYATGYEFIEQAMLRGMDEPDVKSIALMIDSPGGTSNGLFELTEAMAEMRGTKPVKAFVTTMAASAAYAIASAADEIVTSKFSEVGSIGVAMVHVSLASMLEKAGIEVNVIRSSEAKLEGNQFETLSKGAKARLQEQVDRLYAIFVETVARNRNMSEKDVRATEALVFDAQTAIDKGLADRIGTFTQDMSTQDTNTQTGDSSMANDTQSATPAAAANTETVALSDAQLAEARSEGAAQMQKRFASVQAHESFAGREKTANHLLANTDLSADQIIATLQVTDKTVAATPAAAAAAAPGADFAKAMHDTGNPNVPGVDAPDDANLSEDDKLYMELKAARKQIPAK